MSAHYDCVIMEAAGGLYEPLNEETAPIDVIEKNGWQTLLVCSPAAGGIGHCLAVLEGLARRDVLLLGLVYNLNGCAKGFREIFFEVVR